MRESARTIEERATQWVARMDRGDLDAAEQLELSTWLAADPRRQGALLRAQAAWAMLDRASIAAHAQPSPGKSPLRTFGRREILVAGGALAASLAGVVALPSILGERPRRSRISTALGEVRRMPLDDGSVALVNTSSDVDVAFRAKRRSIRVAKGEAWFQVAPDPDRPFVVDAGPVRARALGTAFSVRRAEDGALIQVTEGTVEAWSTSRPEERIKLAAGTKAFIGDDVGPEGIAEAVPQIERSLAWRSGQVVLDGDTLGEAVREFNRYNQQQLVVLDDQLAQERLVGSFRTNEPESFARAVASMFGGTVIESDTEIRIERRHS